MLSCISSFNVPFHNCVGFIIRKDYKGYQIESRLHMRLHSASMKLKKAQGEMEDGGSTAGEARTATLKQSVATDERL